MRIMRMYESFWTAQGAIWVMAYFIGQAIDNLTELSDL